MRYEPHEETLVEEMRNLCRRAYGPKDPDRKPVEHRLINVDRLAMLHGMVHNPYHEMIFGGLSTLDLMRVCAKNLMECLNYREAGKLLAQVRRFEDEDRAAAARQAELQPAEPAEPVEAPNEPEPPAEPEPGPDTYVLDPAAVSVLPKPSADELYLRSLSNSDLARVLLHNQPPLRPPP